MNHWQRIENHNGYCVFARGKEGRRLPKNYIPEEGQVIKCHLSKFNGGGEIQDCIYGGNFDLCKEEDVSRSLLEYIKIGEKQAGFKNHAEIENEKIL